MLRSWLTAFRRARLRLLGAQGLSQPRELAALIACDPGQSDAGRGTIVIGPGAWFEQGVVLHAYGGRIAIGANSFIGPHAVIYGHGGVEIGDDALISMHCRILSSDHAIPPQDRRIRWERDVMKRTRIGHDVWLGAGVTVLGGVTIGDGCVVGAGSVVTRDLPPYSIAIGTPASVVRQRPAGGS